MATVLASVVELDDDSALLSRLEDIHLSPKTKLKCILKLSLCTSDNDNDSDNNNSGQSKNNNGPNTDHFCVMDERLIFNPAFCLLPVVYCSMALQILLIGKLTHVRSMSVQFADMIMILQSNNKLGGS